MEINVDFPHEPEPVKSQFFPNQTKSRAIEENTPRLSDSDRLALFGGDEELLAYYKGIRATSEKVRQNGNRCFCDPRDARMRTRLEQEGWCPAIVVRDLRDEGDGSTEFGLASKQTALDDEAQGTTIGDNDDDDDAAERRKNATDNNLRAEEESKHESFVCGVQGCSQNFTSLASYESHYHTSHNYVCHVCRRTFVSNFLLDVHLEENHDSYFQVLSPRVDMYRCLVESCILKFRTADVRKDHLVTVHKFPAKFSFHGPIAERSNKTKPCKKKKSNNNNSRGSKTRNDNNSSSSCNMDTSNPTVDQTTSSSSAASPTVTHCEAPTMEETSSQEAAAAPAEMEVDQRLKSLECSSGAQLSARGRGHERNRGRGSANRGRGRGGRVPSSICFGRGSQRAFQHQRSGRGRHWHQTQGMDVDTTVDIEKVDFADMIESLER